MAKSRQKTIQALRLADTVFKYTNEAIMVTNADRNIVSVNQAYCNITGFSSEDVLGRNPRLQKSGSHDQAFYQALWENLEQLGHWQGEILNKRKNGDIYPCWESISTVKDSQNNITNYISIFSDISTIKASEEKLRKLAHHDALTGLPNRLMFSSALSMALPRAKRQNHQIALLFLDLDRFKLINDTLGHAAGDQLLLEVSKRLQACVRSNDMVARLGGDEFTILLEGISSPECATIVAKKIIGALTEPIKLVERNVVTSTSIGISLFPNDADTAEDLIKAADAAMYRAKSRGRNTYDYYTLHLTLEAQNRLILENDLREAIRKNQLELYYQPQIDIGSGEIIGVEALLRWHHPERGMLLPGKFIHIAEESNLINEIGDWVIRDACVQAEKWNSVLDKPLQVAINISGRQLQNVHLVSTLESLLYTHGIQPKNVYLELEVTETLLQAVEGATVLYQLQKLGLKIAIDDFGTGYSSLSRIKQLPVDTLKIDQLFMKNIPNDTNNAAITSAIISMSHNLGLKVIAEGIEEPAQLNFLREQGCDVGQGYWFYAAMPSSRYGLKEGKLFISDSAEIA